MWWQRRSTRRSWSWHPEHRTFARAGRSCMPPWWSPTRISGPTGAPTCGGRRTAARAYNWGMLRTFCALALLSAPAFSADVDLFNHKNLDGWEVIGDGVWHVLSDRTLIGERDLRPVLRDAPFLHPG